MLNAIQTDLFRDVEEQVSAANDNANNMWQRRFEAFHEDNPHVYKLFKKYTLEAIAAGRETYSTISIFERIRWYTDIETQGDPFKINQNFATYYGRMFMRDFPQHDGFFRTRKLRS